MDLLNNESACPVYWNQEDLVFRSLLFTCMFLLQTVHAPAAQPEALTGLKQLRKLYDRLPDRNTCDPGTLSQDQIQLALDTLNRIRAVHDLPPVVLDPALQEETDRAALIVAASRTMNHAPPQDTPCYSSLGRMGSWHSNLHIHRYSVWDPDPESNSTSPRSREIRRRIDRNIPTTEKIVIDWLIDYRVEGVGHRRWVLDPFVERVAFSRVDLLTRQKQRWDLTTGSAVNVIAGTRESIPEITPRTIAYPVGNYPSEWFQKGWYLSFSVMVTGSSVHANRYVHMDAADVQMETMDGKPVPVSDVQWNDKLYGIPNLIFWKADGLEDNREYRVTISNVRIGGIPKRYSYTFRLVSPSHR